MTIASIGELLWDVFEDSESLGGAPFNFACHASRLGHEVIFVSAVGDDARGAAAVAKAAGLGLRTDFIQVIPGASTGTVSVRVDSAGQPDFTIHRPAAYDALRLGAADWERLAAIRPEWLYYGTLYQAEPCGRAEVARLAAALPGVKPFYDINLRRDSYSRELLADLLPNAGVVKLNDDEASVIDSLFDCRHESLAEFTEVWSRKFGWSAVAVTRGSRGCAVRVGADYAEPAGHAVAVADTVGAGDAFAAGFLHGLAQGWDAAHTGDFANRVGAVVAARRGGVPPWSMADVAALG